MSVIPATLEAEIRRIMIQSQPGQRVPKLHLQNNQFKMDWRCSKANGMPALQM
jgi:hypothetical protein